MSEYDTDILQWSEHQATLLRRRAAGERVNEAELDRANIAEEIEVVGSGQVHAVTSLLVQAIVYILKAEAWPLARDVPHWQAEARRCSRSIRSVHAAQDRPRSSLSASAARNA